MGSSLDLVDFDRFTLENAAKHSCLVRTPEDAGRNKAECVSARVVPLLDDGCTSNGIDADLCMLGPEAIAEYDVVMLCVDNYAAKALFNEIWMQIPRKRRPIVIMDGTYDEGAQSAILDGEAFCLRCLFDESWIGTAPTSCVGPQLRQIDGVEQVIRTTGLASSVAANLSAEQFRGAVIGMPDVMNRRVSYVAYPNLGLNVGFPVRKHACPGCSVCPPPQIHWIPGSVLETTLKEALEMIGDVLETEDFEILTHQLNYKNVAYSNFIAEGRCRVCGKHIDVYRHEGRIVPQELLCSDCRHSERLDDVPADTLFEQTRLIRAFVKNSDEKMLKMKLFDLGYPLGAHITVVQRNGAKDFLEADRIVETTFAFGDDPAKMHTTQRL